MPTTLIGKILLCVFGAFLLLSCSRSKESCDQLRQIEASQLASRNTINAMNENHASEASQSALNDADDSLDGIQEKIMEECED